MTTEINNTRREKLLRLIEVEIEELLAWEQAAEKPNLTQIEEVVLAARQRIGVTLTENLVAAQQAQLESEAPQPKTPTTGKPLLYKGKKKPGV